MDQLPLQLEPLRKLYSVGELNALIRAVLDAEIGQVWVSGEISGVRLASSGHYYFTLKDGDGQIRCACFRMTARYLRFKPQDGISVIARGRIDVYESRGEYQLLVEALQPQGQGALQVAFERLKRKLAAEGLFEAARKRPLPKLPRRIGIVTSPSGAVIQDILQVLGRRFPGLHIRLYPALVQGDGAVEAVCRGLEYFSKSHWADVVILARGGGSLEDLWAFNEEELARAIALSAVPVVSAVGHETDFTIADFVADLRAPTPSAAAELVICTRDQLFDQLAALNKAMEQLIRYRLSVSARRLHSNGIQRSTTLLHRNVGRLLQRLDELDRCAADHSRRRLRSAQGRLTVLESRLQKMDLRLRFAEAHRRLEELRSRACASMAGRINRSHLLLDPMQGQLAQLSPLKVLERGYAIVTDTGGHVIKQAGEVNTGELINVRVAKGSLGAQVQEKRVEAERG